MKQRRQMHNPSKTYQKLIDENALLKQQIRKIEKSEARYKMLFTSAAEGILVANRRQSNSYMPILLYAGCLDTRKKSYYN